MYDLNLHCVFTCFPSQSFQRQVHERLTQLELVNKQYRRLARENRTDAASKLKVMVHEGNQRWDSLQRRVAAVLRRLKVRQHTDVGHFRQWHIWPEQNGCDLTVGRVGVRSPMKLKLRARGGEESNINTSLSVRLIPAASPCSQLRPKPPGFGSPLRR